MILLQSKATFGAVETGFHAFFKKPFSISIAIKKNIVYNSIR